METAGKHILIVGVDDSEHSIYALEWTLDKFFSSTSSNLPFKLIIVHARPHAASIIGLAGPGAADVFPYVELDLKKAAERVMDKAKGLCEQKLVQNVSFEVLEGDPRNVMCDIVDKYQASILVVGSHGYGVIKRAVLGSVSDYLAHHAHCSVMIVKRPKTKH
ncbi:hypothetical protein IFM89_029370 [Coptis chinensis]|uniref:UspA domain-containing protein n=1 Tax=Coptis chinensis TaxID=261450 RepID=A0A835IQW1_9MAGN|nr:hypothetical protein IFM89_029370 [Coptis chinensis]